LLKYTNYIGYLSTFPSLNFTPFTGFFTDVAEVRDVYIPLDFYTKRQKTFAFIEFTSPGDARRAIEKLDGEKVEK